MRRLVLTTIALAILTCLVPASAGAATVSTPQFQFAPTPFGSQTAAQTVTFSIAAADTPRSTDVFIAPCRSTGGDATCDFVITANTCPPAFGPGIQTCSISVAYRPIDNPLDPGPQQSVNTFASFGSLQIGPQFPSVSLRGTEIKPTLAPSKPKGKGKKCGKKKGKGKRAASAAKAKCGKKK